LNILLNEKIQEIASWKNEWEALNSEKTDWELKLTEVQNLVNEVNGEKIRLEETVVDLKRELFKAEEALESAGSAETNSSSNDEIVEGLNKKIEALTEKTDKLKSQKQELEKEVPELLAKIAELSTIIDSQKNTEEGLDKNKISPNLASLLADSLKDKKSAKLK